MPKKGDDEKMLSYTFRVPGELLDRLKERAGLIPVSVIIRRLIEKFIKGEVDINQ